MIKWLLTTIVILFLLSALTDHLARFGFGRLPGDFSIPWGQRRISIPLGSTVVFSLLASAVAKFL